MRPERELGTEEDRLKCASAAKALPPTKVDIVITHKGCPDGYTAAYMVGKPTLYMDPGQLLTDELIEQIRGQKVLMIDIAPANDMDYNQYESVTSCFVVLDHHISNITMYGLRPNFFGCYELSGASAAYYYKSGEYSELVQVVVTSVHERDLWMWKGTDQQMYNSKAFSLAFGEAIKEMAPHIALNFVRDVCEDLSTYSLVLHNGIASMQTLERKTAELESLLQRTTIYGHDVAIIDVTDRGDLKIAVNEGGNVIAERLNCIVMFITRRKIVRCSLRGKGCIGLALKFNGGGHADAAGFTLTPEAYAELFASTLM